MAYIWDNNTKAFHQSIKLRRIQNRINTIKKEDGSWAKDSIEVAATFLDF